MARRSGRGRSALSQERVVVAGGDSQVACERLSRLALEQQSPEDCTAERMRMRVLLNRERLRDRGARVVGS